MHNPTHITQRGLTEIPLETMLWVTFDQTPNDSQCSMRRRGAHRPGKLRYTGKWHGATSTTLCGLWVRSCGYLGHFSHVLTIDTFTNSWGHHLRFMYKRRKQWQ